MATENMSKISFPAGAVFVLTMLSSMVQNEGQPASPFTVSGEMMKTPVNMGLAFLMKGNVSGIGEVRIAHHPEEKKSEAKGLNGILLKTSDCKTECRHLKALTSVEA